MIPTMTNLPVIRPSNGGGVLGQTFSLFIKNALALLLITAITIVPVQLISNYGFPFEFKLLSYSIRDVIISIIFLTLLIPVVVHYLIERLRGGKASVAQAYRWGLSKWLRMIMYDFLQNVILTAGLLLFVIPGLFMYVRLLLLPIVVAIENTSVTNPLETSRNMAKGQFWGFIGYSIVINGFTILVTWVTGELFISLDFINGISVTLFYLFINWISLLGIILTLVLYLKIKSEQNSAAAQQNN
ncbi:hypothetical protein PALU110988_24305 [Paenibacillus lupini]|uniref:hypothetical protein n=1 Tax=Paenibacillus lupini TaxID=1450204 RepID=UPI001422B5FA|nr:hypothetical protein [Paenibacillus lupini]NIK26652.1 hypothetical protein [Paenibacillus lupini]